MKIRVSLVITIFSRIHILDTLFFYFEVNLSMLVVLLADLGLHAEKETRERTRRMDKNCIYEPMKYFIIECAHVFMYHTYLYSYTVLWRINSTSLERTRVNGRARDGGNAIKIDKYVDNSHSKALSKPLLYIRPIFRNIQQMAFEKRFDCMPPSAAANF